VVDDEKSIRIFLKASLYSYGYQVIEMATGKEALAEVFSSQLQLIILDLGLPDIDGQEVIRKIRKKSKVPIIILSVREDPADKISALDAGADDYLTKPFSIGELISRIKAVLRRLLPAESEKILKTGRLMMDLDRRQVFIGDKEIDLTPTEYTILKLLLQNAGKVLTHGQLLEDIWKMNEDYEGALHLLRVTISNLRSKVEPNLNRPAYIMTESGIGYRLRAEA
jgi:two-component system KDP operon response regulator KdpE